MSTLIAVYNSEGCVGRCDARCYNATDASCDCICGGANHGKGLTVAQAQTAELGATWLERFSAEQHLNLAGIHETHPDGHVVVHERPIAVGWINRQHELALDFAAGR